MRGSVVMASLAVALSLTSCGVQQTQVDTSIIQDTQDSLNMDELYAAGDQLVEDLKKYENSPEMVAYAQAVHDALDFSHEDGVTQSDIDAAGRTITSLRAVAIDPTLSSECEPLPSYDAMVADPDQYVGHVFQVSGNVTSVSNDGVAMKGEAAKADYFICVYWDESNTSGEVAYVRVSRNRYESTHAHFDGRCVFEGLNESGRPQFYTFAYESD